MRALLVELLARHTGRDRDRIAQDIERDLHLDARQAVEYGLADHLVGSRKGPAAWEVTRRSAGRKERRARPPRRAPHPARRSAHRAARPARHARNGPYGLPPDGVFPSPPPGPSGLRPRSARVCARTAPPLVRTSLPPGTRPGAAPGPLEQGRGDRTYKLPLPPRNRRPRT